MTHLPASIEMSPKQAAGSISIPDGIPKGTRVYLSDMGEETASLMVAGARNIREAGLEPVPHFAARRIHSRESLVSRLDQLSAEADIRDVLIIGGGVAKPLGPFASSLELLATGEFDRHHISHIGLAGHPEGSPDFSDEAAETALRLKQAFAERSDATCRIVTQFGFDAEGFIQWAESLRDADIDLPVHIGVAGPAKLTTMIKFATLCGVGNSLQFIKQQASKVSTLLAGFDPETIVQPIEQHACTGNSAITQLHVYPFGGVQRATDWLIKRGNWSW